MSATGSNIDDEACAGRGDCLEMCPGDGLEVAKCKATTIQREDCEFWPECEPVCEQGATECGYEITFAEEGGP